MGIAKLKDSVENGDEFADELAPGATLMHGQYTIESFLNAGGFGITYSARDSLDRRVVIKECFPGAFCRRSTALVTARSRAHTKELQSIVRLFVQEARSLAKLDHPNIVGVHQVFEENNTAYMALDFVEGRDLLDLIEDENASLTTDEVRNILRKLLDAVGFIHKQEILHRDISPDNILLDQDKNPILIDFGAAREQASKQSRVLSAMRVVKDGYSPQEFYIAGSEQGPYSDLYALGASFYHIITGELPPNSQARLAAVAGGDADPYQPLVGRIEGYDDAFLAALDKAMAILPKDRIASADAWLQLIDSKDPVVAMVADMVAAKPEEPTADPKAASKIAVEPIAEEKPKSRSAILLGTVAAIALIGVGIATQTDILSSSDTAEQASISAIPAPAPAPAVVDAAPAIEATPPPQDNTAVVVETDVATLPQPAEAIADPVAPEVSAPTERLAEAVVTAEAVEAQTDGPTATEADTTVASTELIEDGEPPVTVERDVPEALETPANGEAVEEIAALVTPPAETPVEEPAVVEEPVAVEEPVEEAPVAEDPVTEPTVAEEAEPAPIAEAPVFEEPFDVPGMLTDWSVELPYDGFFDGGQGETKIFAVNGLAVNNRTDFDVAVRDTTTLTGGDTVAVTVNLGVDPATAENQVWSLPVIQRTMLLSGLMFETRSEGDGWITRIARVPEGIDADIEPGDVVFGYIPTSEVLRDRIAMPRILAQASDAGQTSLNFAISRGDATWAVSIPFTGDASN